MGTTNELALEDISSRLRKVETENRWLKIFVLITLSGLVFIGAKGKDIREEIQTKQIRILGESHNVLLTEDGLFFLPKVMGGERFGTYYGPGALEIRTMYAQTLIYLGEKWSNKKPVPALRMFSEDGKSTAFLTMGGDGDSSLRFRINGKERVILGKTELIDNKSGSEISRPPTSLVFFDENGKVVWSAP